MKAVTEGKPKGWKIFQKELEKLGYEVKWGKDLSVRKHGMKRFVRLKSLGKGYTEEEILIAVTEDATKRIARQIEQNNAPPQFLIDIEQKIREGKGKGYESWASDFNFKQKAKTLFFLQENKIRTMEEIEEKVRHFTGRFNDLSVQIKEKEKRLREIGEIKKAIINYSKTREFYEEYRKAGYSKKYYEKHRAEITIHKAAKKIFDEYKATHPGIKKLPRVKELSAEYGQVLQQKKELYQEYKEVRKEMNIWAAAKANTKIMLDIDERNEKGNHERNHRERSER